MTSRTDAYQIGLSATPANNFTISTDLAGGMKIARGIVGATTQDILSVDTAGVVTINTKLKVAVPCFKVHKSANQNVPDAAATQLSFDVVDWDEGGYYTPGNSRYTPLVAGYYQINWRAYILTGGGTMSDFGASLAKNGAGYANGNTIFASGSVTGGVSVGTALVLMNGTTDYLSVNVYQDNTSNVAATVNSNVNVTSFEGVLVKAL